MTLEKKNTKFSFVIHGFLGKNSKNGGDKQTLGKKEKIYAPNIQGARFFFDFHKW